MQVGAVPQYRTPRRGYSAEAAANHTLIRYAAAVAIIRSCTLVVVSSTTVAATQVRVSGGPAGGQKPGWSCTMSPPSLAVGRYMSGPRSLSDGWPKAYRRHRGRWVDMAPTVLAYVAFLPSRASR